MTSKRRKRSDSVAGDLEIFQGATDAPIEPPGYANLPDAVKPFWYSIVTAKAARAWNDHDLEMAVDLAWCKYKSSKLMVELQSENDVVDGAQGGPIANPKHKILDMLVKRSRMLAAHLQVHPEATQGKSREQREQNEKHRNARGSSEDKENSLNSLIPTQSPSH